jgi:hypothetical protein
MKSFSHFCILFILFAILSGRIYCQNNDEFLLIPRLSFYSPGEKTEILLHIPSHQLYSYLDIKLKVGDEVICEWNGIPGKLILRLPVLSTILLSGTIDAEIVVNRSGNNKIFTSCRLIVLPHKANEVKTDRLTGGLIVNGRQFFPFGFYSYSPVHPSLPEEEAVRGFNMISPYQKILPETLNERKAYMDRCAELGMKVNYNLLSVSGGGGVASKIEGLTEEQKRERLISEINTFMNHPALLGWYISDEPTGNNISTEALEEIYKVVKETDPWHPVSVVFMAPFLSSRKYSKGLDIVMADPYPIPDLPASMVGDVTGKLKKEFHGEKPVWIVPQAFGGGELWSREPTLQEIRSMTYQAVINGATGIQYFVRQGLNAFPKSVSTWGECGRMAVEIAELTPWLLSDEEANSAVSFQKNISVTSKLHNGQLILFAVNKTNEPQYSGISVSGIGNTKAKVIFENRSVAVNGGTISDLLPAFGSQVYLIDLKNIKNEIVPFSKNMMTDPGFEDISTTGIPAACYAWTEGDRGATYFLDSREHLEGNHSLRIVTPTDSNSVSLKFFPVKVSAGSTYLLSVWAKADPEQRFPEQVSQRSSTAIREPIQPQFVEISLSDFGKARFIPGSEWKQFVTFVTIPADTLPVIKAGVILKMPGQGVAWFDMLQVIEDPLNKTKDKSIAGDKN